MQNVHVAHVRSESESQTLGMDSPSRRKRMMEARPGCRKHPRHKAPAVLQPPESSVPSVKDTGTNIASSPLQEIFV